MAITLLVHVADRSELNATFRLIASVDAPFIIVCDYFLAQYFADKPGSFTIHQEKDMSKDNGSWSVRFLNYWLSLQPAKGDLLAKVEPGTLIVRLPKRFPSGFDIYGDFRRTTSGWVWQAGFQVFTRHAAEVLTADQTLATEPCIYQNTVLVKALVRNGLKSCNISDKFNGWYQEGDAWKVVYSSASLGRDPKKSKLPPGLNAGAIELS